MGLTRLRAEQISDIDYKQAVRVITVTDITNLSGGAPNQVDGVNLSAGDRILVTAQDPGSENGIYQVQTVGTGSNGTWIRSADTNQTGELEAGTIVMVTEGVVYKDTQWKLITNNPIVIGTTSLTFEQNSAYAFGNIVANTTAILATSVADTVTFSGGSGISISGNNTSKTVTIAATGSAEVTSIANGTSNVAVVGSGGNVAVGIGGSGNVAEFSTSGLKISGLISATGNITGNYIIGNGSQLTGLSSSYGNADVAAYLSSGTVSANILTTGNISASGNITGANINSSNADLAEMYVADQNYAPGTVVEFGGTYEVTIATVSHSTQIAGIVSTNPSYLMNVTQTGNNVVPVALTGRVPCSVVGTIKKGDRLVASDISGVAEKLNLAKYEPGCIIGKALENYDSDRPGVIEVVVGRT